MSTHRTAKLVSLCMCIAFSSHAFAVQEIASGGRDALESRDYELRSKIASASMTLTELLFNASEQDFKSGGLTQCVMEGTTRLEEISESEQYATNSVTTGAVFRREVINESDYATAIFNRQLVLQRYEKAIQSVKSCVAKNSR